MKKAGIAQCSLSNLCMACWAYLPFGHTGFKPSVSSYNRILIGYIKFQRAHEIHAVLDEMAKDGIQKNAHTNTLLIQAYASNFISLPKAFGTY